MARGAFYFFLKKKIPLGNFLFKKKRKLFAVWFRHALTIREANSKNIDRNRRDVGSWQCFKK